MCGSFVFSYGTTKQTSWFFVAKKTPGGQKLLLHEKFLELLWSLSIAFTVFAVSIHCGGGIWR
jgi:hypothetical protein